MMLTLDFGKRVGTRVVALADLKGVPDTVRDALGPFIIATMTRGIQDMVKDTFAAVSEKTHPKESDRNAESVRRADLKLESLKRGELSASGIDVTATLQKMTGDQLSAVLSDEQLDAMAAIIAARKAKKAK